MPTWKLFDFRIRRDQRDGSPKILSFLLQINCDLQVSLSGGTRNNYKFVQTKKHAK